VVAAVAVSAAALGVLGFGYGTIPALGPALDPGRGAWTAAADGKPVTSQQLRVAGLTAPVTISFDAQGLASVNAGSTHDLFLALGYLHAKFRLSELDAERRLGEGRLSELAGPADLKSDEFELRLGLLRTARNEWARTAGVARAALLAYAQGVNDDIAAVRASGDWPALFTLTGVYPGSWTPIDSLVIQGVLTQELDYTTGPLDYAVLQKSLGQTLTADWLPTTAKNAQTPYDPGPYTKAPLDPLAPTNSAPQTTTTSVMSGADAPDITEISTYGSSPGYATTSGSTAEAAGNLLTQISQLPANSLHHYPDSNAWAANGPAVAGGGALLGGDPHLPQTLPSVWYEVALSAPGYQVAGVSVPGLPGILLGHNANIAWSLTDTQNSATFYYAEQVKGNQYYLNGAWHPLTTVHYEIPVRGGATKNLTVQITEHGPIMNQVGQTMAVDWMGNAPSDDLGALLAVNKATTFTEFKAALARWHAPTQNFVYADKSGNIGVIAPGYYPQVPATCQPWLPMPGTGACDITGVIPYRAVPQSYNPPSHVIATGNQRPVTADYPYYVGTAYDFYDPGYRAAHAYQELTSAEPLTMASIAALQNDVTDSLAGRVLPSVLTALDNAKPELTVAERAAIGVLTNWNSANQPATSAYIHDKLAKSLRADSMNQGSAGATLWWTFWGDYLNAVFEPWWKRAKVPVGKDKDGLKIQPGFAPLTEDLEAWTLTGQSNPAFAGPGGHGPGNAQAAIVAAFRTAVSHLASQLTGDPATWTWHRLHTRSFPSITGADGLGYGPRPASGDPFTENAADGGLDAHTGPSWRMIVGFGAAATPFNGTPALGEMPAAPPAGLAAYGVYPGGQSENPASPWYTNLVPFWWDGQYLPVPVPGQAAGQPAGKVTWMLING
jgi:penicillin amidase